MCGWSFTSGQSAETEISPANPAAGAADFTVFTVPAGQAVTLESLTFTFVTDATAGNRVVRIEIRDGAGNVVTRIPCLSADPASTTSLVTAFIGSAGTGGASGGTTAALPNMQMLAGWSVHVTVTGTVGVGDQISATFGAIVTGASGAFATIFDGGQAIGFSAIPAGGTDTQPLLDYGIKVETHVSVQATAGTINGVLWYLLESDLADPYQET